MIVTLTFIPIGGEIISGIPRLVDITSSSPATIYYTLDGTLPTQLSNIFTDLIELPTDEGTVTLSAVGFFLDGYSNLVPTPVLSNIYRSDTSEIARSKFLFFQGITYMFPGGLNIPFWYDQDGYASVFLDIPEEDLEFVISERNEDGSDRETPFEVKRISPSQTATRQDDDFQLFDVPSSATFNPDALFILIDGRNPVNLNDVLLINGPHLNLRDPRTNFGGLDFYSNKNTNYRSTHFARTYYDRKKGICVFYYFDTNNGRWIKSIQKLPTVDTKSLPKPVFSNPVVFKWFNFGRHSAI